MSACGVGACALCVCARVLCVRVSACGTGACAVCACAREGGSRRPGSGRAARMRSSSGSEPAGRREAGGGSPVVWRRQEVAGPACSCRRAAAVPGPGQDAVVSTEKREPGRERRLRQGGRGAGAAAWRLEGGPGWGGWGVGGGWGRCPQTLRSAGRGLCLLFAGTCVPTTSPPPAWHPVAVSSPRPSAGALTACPGPWSPRSPRSRASPPAQGPCRNPAVLEEAASSLRSLPTHGTRVSPSWSQLLLCPDFSSPATRTNL